MHAQKEENKYLSHTAPTDMLIVSVGIDRHLLFLPVEHVESPFVGSWSVGEMTVLGQLSVLVCVCQCSVNWPLHCLKTGTSDLPLPQIRPMALKHHTCC